MYITIKTDTSYLILYYDDIIMKQIIDSINNFDKIIYLNFTNYGYPYYDTYVLIMNDDTIEIKKNIMHIIVPKEDFIKGIHYDNFDIDNAELKEWKNNKLDDETDFKFNIKTSEIIIKENEQLFTLYCNLYDLFEHVEYDKVVNEIIEHNTGCWHYRGIMQIFDNYVIIGNNYSDSLIKISKNNLIDILDEMDEFLYELYDEYMYPKITSMIGIFESAIPNNKLDCLPKCTYDEMYNMFCQYYYRYDHGAFENYNIERNNKIREYMDKLFKNKPSFEAYFHDILDDTDDKFLGLRLNQVQLYIIEKVNDDDEVIDIFHPNDIGLDEIIKKYDYLEL